MILRHARHPGRMVRLAYCQNVHAADTLPELERAWTQVTEDVRRRVAARGPFGVGPYLPAPLVRALEHDAARFAALRDALARLGHVPFTWNAFPFERFHVDGLKSDVFRPAWGEPAREDYTLAVARVAARLAADDPLAAGGHVSVSTHTGDFGARVRGPEDRARHAASLARCVVALAELERACGVRVVLSLEPEPRASAANARELAPLLALVRAACERTSEGGADAFARHVGLCYDACHAAIEGDPPPHEALPGVALGKVQYSNAVVVRDPARNPRGVAALLALAEPRYLHQVRGHAARPARAIEDLVVDDLPELARELAGPRRDAWLACAEWRCHLHVPVDLEAVGGELATTRADADRALSAIVAAPERWGTRDLHVEIETYTWDVLPAAVRGEGGLGAGLAREYGHVRAVLAGLGWSGDGA